MADTIDKLHPNGLSSLATVAEMYDVSASTLRRRWQQGLFPKPVKLPSENPSNAKNYFKNSDLLKYNESLEYEE